MPLFRSQNAKMLQALTSSMRLLLPADPGPDRMLDAIRQFNPAARPDGTRIYVDGSTLYVGRPFEVEPQVAQKAGLPADITTAYFINFVDRGPQFAGEVFTKKYQDRERNVKADYRAQGSYVLGGLAARFGGLSVPPPAELGEPLHASVYTSAPLGGDELASLVARHAPGLRAGQADPAEQHVTVVFTGGGPFEIACYSPGGASAHLMDEELKGSRAVPGHTGGASAQGLLVLRTQQPAAQAGQDTARAVGETALGLAADAGGICLDVFGFRVRQADELVIR